MTGGQDLATPAEGRARSIVPCNFRTSGLLSNESTRQFRSMHETFARGFSHALDLFLGSALEVKLLKVDQLGAREFSTSFGTGSYLVPLALQPLGERAVACFDNGLFFPLLDILLGGTGDQPEETRELTEIDEELFRSVTELMCAQLERAWKGSGIAVSPQASVKSLLAGQLFLLEERVVTLQFEIHLSAITVPFELALPAQFAGALIRGSHPEPATGSSTQHGAQTRMRQRLMNCRVPLQMSLYGSEVPLSDLLALEAGSVLKLRMPLETPIHLRAGSHTLFEVSPVRKGNHKAAQIVAYVPATGAEQT